MQWLSLLCLQAVIVSLWYFGSHMTGKSFTDLDQILASGELVLLTQENAHNYYRYNGAPMGFEYELAKAFADYLGVRLTVKTVDTWDGLIDGLTRGDGALVGASMTVTESRKRQVRFSDPYLTIQQHIIVHRSSRKINTPEDLAGRTVHVAAGTSYHERLKSLQEEGLTLSIETHEGTSTEDLLRKVASRDVPVTVADSNVALLNRRYYPRIAIKGALKAPEQLAWAVHRDARKLLYRINTFFRTIRENGRFSEIYGRYYGDVTEFDYVNMMMFQRKVAAVLPRYAGFIREAAEENGFDWRLIAAQMYQESHFDPLARSHANAIGLMQLLPKTAKSLSVTDIFDPEQNIRAGVRHLKAVYELFDQAKENDRMMIALATYNIGYGHMFDARNLARRKGLDPNRWASIAQTLPLLMQREYYADAKYGYCRGSEPVNYIRQVMRYYDILRHAAAFDPKKTLPAARSSRAGGAPKNNTAI